MADRTSEHSEVEQLREEISRLREDISSIAGSLTKVARARAQAGSSQAYDEMEHLRDRFKDTYDSVRREGSRAVGGLEAEIEHRPFTFLAGAFIVGLLLGKFMSDR